MANRWLLDTSALLALRDNEAGAEHVAALLRQAIDAQSMVLACFMSRMEVLYRVWKDENDGRPASLMPSCSRYRSAGWPPATHCWSGPRPSRPAMPFRWPMPGLPPPPSRKGRYWYTRIRNSRRSAASPRNGWFETSRGAC